MRGYQPSDYNLRPNRYSSCNSVYCTFIYINAPIYSIYLFPVGLHCLQFSPCVMYQMASFPKHIHQFTLKRDLCRMPLSFPHALQETAIGKAFTEQLLTEFLNTQVPSSPSLDKGQGIHVPRVPLMEHFPLAKSIFKMNHLITSK